MTSWVATVRDSLRTQLWPLPTLAVVTALLLGLLVPALDTRLADDLDGTAGRWLFGGGAGAARSLLETIASSLITVTSLTFSLTVVTLQLASSQFSPRLLRTFNSDRFVQATLALFLGTFTYALTVLRAVRSASEDGETEFVPKVAVTLAFVLAILSVLALVLFLAHLTEKIRVESMLSNVRSDARRTMQAMLPPVDESDSAAPDAPERATRVRVGSEGFLSSIDHRALVGVAVDEDVVIAVDARMGDFLVSGTPLGRVWTTDGTELGGERVEGIGARVDGCLTAGFERTSVQDVGFGLRQLVDVANKALSPGVNDPTTAVHALGHVSALLCDLTDRALGPCLLRDDDGRVRAVLARPDLATYLDLGLTQPRLYGASDPQVVARLLRVTLDLSHRVAPHQRQAVRDQLALLVEGAEAQGFDERVLGELTALAEEVARRLDAA